MKSWENLQADRNKILTNNYTPGRGGNSISRVVLHHNAGNLSIDSIHDLWENNRQASAHYQVTSDGEIGQIVWDKDTAWHSGNFHVNQTSIGIEHANNNSDPWTISEACLVNGAHLTAAVCKYYGLGRPAWRKNVFPHSDFQSTACPGSINGSQRDRYMSLAGQFYDDMVAGRTTSTSAPKPSVDLNALADAVIRGDYGNGEERKARLGSNYQAVQDIVNKKLNGSTSTSAPKPSVDLNALADAVIRGDYGNGEERKARLGSNYQAVQDIVNKKLLG